MNMVEEFEKNIKYTNQLIAMVDEELNSEGEKALFIWT